MAERLFAGTYIEIDAVLVAKVTNFSNDISINETEVTGSEDVVVGSSILTQKNVVTKMSETLALEGIAVIADAGQSDLETAARTGAQAVLHHHYQDASGTAYTGYFTAFKKGGSVSDAVYKWSGSFRVNSEVAV